MSRAGRAALVGAEGPGRLGLAGGHRWVRRRVHRRHRPAGTPAPRPAPAREPRWLAALAAEPQLAGYHYLPAARAEHLRRLHRTGEARLAYDEALLLAGNTTERDHLTTRCAGLDA